MTNITSIEMDIAWDYFDNGDFENEMNKRALAWEVIELEGPGGGNPFVKIIGTPMAIRNFVTMDDTLDDWIYDEIEDLYPQLM